MLRAVARPSVRGCLIQGVKHLPAASVLKNYSKAKAVHWTEQNLMKEKASTSTVDLTLSDDERDVPRKRQKPCKELPGAQQAVSAANAAAESHTHDDQARRRIMAQAAQVCQRAASCLPVHRAVGDPRPRPPAWTRQGM